MLLVDLVLVKAMKLKYLSSRHSHERTVRYRYRNSTSTQQAPDVTNSTWWYMSELIVVWLCLLITCCTVMVNLSVFLGSAYQKLFLFVNTSEIITTSACYRPIDSKTFQHVYYREPVQFVSTTRMSTCCLIFTLTVLT